MTTPAKTHYVILIPERPGHPARLIIRDRLTAAMDKYDALMETWRRDKTKPKWIGEVLIEEKETA